jgi:outer membrane protein TolC
MQLFAQQQVLTIDEFIALVKNNHPVAKQAYIVTEKADAALLSARGAFDPNFMLDASKKTFDGKNYYFYTNPEIKIPTWFGIDVKAGIENNKGAYINPEKTFGKNSYLGVELPLAKGLLMDKRRATLLQAKIFQNQSRQEKQQIINDLLYDAYAGYVQWAGTYQLYTIYDAFLQAAANRLRMVRISFANGERSAMDTLEAYTQLQSFEILKTDAFMKRRDASLEMSNFLWQQNDSVVLLPAFVIPDSLLFAAKMYTVPEDTLVAIAVQQHPALQSYNYKLDALEIEKKLKFQSLLPTINAKANILNKDYNVFKDVNSSFLEKNYKWGIDIKLPLFLREARADYKQTNLKIQETNYQVSNKQREIENKVRSYYNQFMQLQQQLETAKDIFKNYTMLLQQEELRFKNGESSLFVINSRENKLIEAAQKMVEIEVKYHKAYYAMQWSAGLLQ